MIKGNKRNFFNSQNLKINIKNGLFTNSRNLVHTASFYPSDMRAATNFAPWENPVNEILILEHNIGNHAVCKSLLRQIGLQRTRILT